jgi:hypothetical protein
MAKLRDTAVKDNLNIAGNVTAAGKVLSVEGHTHTPANITGLDKYIEDKVKTGSTTLPANTDAKTLDGHAVSDFVLKSESAGSNNDIVRILKFTGQEPYTSLLFSKSIVGATNKIKSIVIETIKSIITLTPVLGIIYKQPLSYIERPDTVVDYSSTSDNTTIVLNIGTILPFTVKIFGDATEVNNLNLTVSSSRNAYGFDDEAGICVKNTKQYISENYIDINDSMVAYKITNNMKYVCFHTYSYNDLTNMHANFRLYDLDNDIIIRIIGTNIFITGDGANIIAQAQTKPFYYNEKTFAIDRSILSNNLVIYTSNYVTFTNTFNGARNIPYFNLSNPTSDSNHLGMDVIKSLFPANSININGTKYDISKQINLPTNEVNCNINGIHFDGKTDITIPAPTNALTLGGLDSGQYIKVTDVGNAAGKIPRFDNDGFLVYPDGSKERIENG